MGRRTDRTGRRTDSGRQTARQRGYDRQWEVARYNYLVFHPFCAMCKKIAQVVDHIKPHKGDPRLFWDKSNWQSLCTSCHNTLKKQIESKGYHKEIGEDGWPTDPNHPANKSGKHIFKK